MEIKLEEHTCAFHGCGVPFWLTTDFIARRRQDKRSFYCPNGHLLVFSGETDAQKLARVTREKDTEIGLLKQQLHEKAKRRRTKRRA